MNEDLKFLRLVPIFSELPDYVLKYILGAAEKKTYAKNAPILSEQESGTSFFVIISGKVKVFRQSEEGREIILAILSDTDFFGEMAIIDGMNRSAFCAALEPTELMIIKQEDFLNILNNHPEVAIALLQELTKRLRAADIKIKSLSLKDAEGKIAAVLVQFADEFGKIIRGVVEIEKLPPQQDIAGLAGTSRETVSRSIHSFIKRGLIEVDGNKLRILDYKKFKDLFN